MPETLACIEPATLKPGGSFDVFPPGSDVCLAHKVSHYFFAWTDDGYALSARGTATYVPLSAADIAHGQATHELPRPMPAYSLDAGDYVLGLMGWPVLAIVLVAAILRRGFRIAFDPSAPLTTSAPILARAGDQFLAAQVAPQLAAGEAVTHQAYARTPRGIGVVHEVRRRAYHLALTDRRLIAIEARDGAFGAVLENLRTWSIPRSEIAGVARAGASSLDLHTTTHQPVRFIVTHSRNVSAANQAAFLQDVPRLMPQTGPVLAR